MLNFFKTKKTPLTEIFPDNFIDIHSHLLPGIDDGAKNMSDSIMLIKRMQKFGIKNFICTPHIMEGLWENSTEDILNKLAELKQELAQHNITDITINAAAEYMLDTAFNNLLKKGNLLTLKDSYILVEMSYLGPPINIYETLFSIQVAGYIPVLAHPERYLYLHQNYSEYQKLKDAGCLFQLNLLSLSNYYGKSVQQTALKLLKDSFINFVGTDTHNNAHLSYLENINNPKIIKLIQPILKNNELFIS